MMNNLNERLNQHYSVWNQLPSTFDTRRPATIVPLAQRLDNVSLNAMNTMFLLDVRDESCTENAVIFDYQRGLIKTIRTTRQLILGWVHQLGLAGPQLVRQIAVREGLSLCKLPIIQGVAALLPVSTAKRGNTNWYNLNLLSYFETQGVNTELVYDQKLHLKLGLSPAVVKRQVTKARLLQDAVLEHHHYQTGTLIPTSTTAFTDETSKQILYQYGTLLLRYHGLAVIPRELNGCINDFLGTL